MARAGSFTLGESGGRPALIANYDIIAQLSVDAQWTKGATLWKLEALARHGQGDLFGATVLGVEHTLFGLGSGATDLGLLAEVLLDARGEDAPPAPFASDVFFGARWARNDEADTSLLGGPVIDFETRETIAFVEAERRIAARWTAELEARWFGNTESGTFLAGIRRNGFLTLRVSRYF